MAPEALGDLIHGKDWAPSDGRWPPSAGAPPSGKEVSWWPLGAGEKGKRVWNSGWGWERNWVGWAQIPREAAGISTC